MIYVVLNLGKVLKRGVYYEIFFDWICILYILKILVCKCFFYFDENYFVNMEIVVVGLIYLICVFYKNFILYVWIIKFMVGLFDIEKFVNWKIFNYLRKVFCKWMCWLRNFVMYLYGICDKYIYFKFKWLM